MTAPAQILVSMNIMVVILLSVTALYGLLVSRNLIRILIALELLTKAVTLMLAFAGFLTGRTALAQSFIITLIVIEVVVIAVASAVVIGAYRQYRNVDVKNLESMKG